MTRYQRNESGFGLVGVLLGLVVIALIAGVGWFAYSNIINKSSAKDASAKMGKPASSKTTPSPSPDASKAASSNTKTLIMRDLGIEMLNVPSSIADLNYVVKSIPGTGTGSGSMAFFSTVTLTNLDQNCSPNGGSPDGVVTKINGTYNNNDTPQGTIAFVKQLKGFWIGYSSPASTCSSNPTTEALHASQTAAFQKLVTNASNIQGL